MDFSFSDEQNALREVARKILEAECTPDRLREIEKSDERIDRRLWAELAKANLLGAALPEAHGGSGYGFFELCVLLEEIGRTVAPVPAWATLVCGALPIARFGNAAQQKRWLPGVVAGDVILTAALQEPNNVDPLAPLAKATKDGGARQPAGSSGWKLSGEKFCVPAAFVAERILVPANTGDGKVGLFLVDPHAVGREAREAVRHRPRDPGLADARRRTRGRGRRARRSLGRSRVARSGWSSARPRRSARSRSVSPTARCASPPPTAPSAGSSTARSAPSRRSTPARPTPTSNSRCCASSPGRPRTCSRSRRRRPTPCRSRSSSRATRRTPSPMRRSTCTAESAPTSTTPCTATTCGRGRSS